MSKRIPLASVCDYCKQINSEFCIRQCILAAEYPYQDIRPTEIVDSRASESIGKDAITD